MKTLSHARLSWRRHTAFSLVEVTLALGIVSFCLLSLTGLLTTGLTSVRESRDEAAAGAFLERLTQSLDSALVDSSGTNYHAIGVYSNVTWSLGQAAQTYQLDKISASGQPSSTDPRFVARVEITPPDDTMTSGRAIIRIAWPATAKWSESSQSWTNAQGSVSTWQVLLPKQ